MIRPAEAKDETPWLEIRNDPEARFWSGFPGPIGVRDHARWFRAAIENPLRHVLRVADEGGQVVGYARLEIDVVGKVSFGVLPDYRGRGIGGELLKALDDEAAGNEVTQHAWVHPSNIPSVRAFLRRGYVLGGEPGYQLLVKRN